MAPVFLREPVEPLVLDVEGESIEVDSGTEVRALVPSSRERGPQAALGAIYNQRLVSLSYRLRSGGTLRFVTFADRPGWDIYRRSACLVLYEAQRRLYPELHLVLQQTHGDGLYYDVRGVGEGVTFGKERCAQLSAAMQEIVREDLAFTVRRISVDAARAQLRDQGHEEKLHLLRTHWETSVRIVSCGEYMDLFHNPVAYRTGAIRRFKLAPYDQGFLLRLPRRGDDRVRGRIQVSRKLFDTHQRTRKWNAQAGVASVGQLNQLTVSGELEPLCLVAEGVHEKRIADIAEQIATAKRPRRLVLVAGPSSSGKTTFVQRLSVQLRVQGLQPVALSVDHFFLPRDRTPVDATGEYDFECLEALDLPLFNQVLTELFSEGYSRIPRYDFHTGTRNDPAVWQELTVGPDQVVLVEGIHALNPQLTEAVPSRDKFRIYISALTQLSLDAHNRIFTSDTRLLRRIVRDRRYRGYSAAETIRRWPLVRRGEMTHIFPFQDQADLMFNSALVYEHAVLRNRVERYLLEVPEQHPSFTEAYRLLGFLRLIVPASDEAVPHTSLLREFIGGSAFTY